MDIVNVIAKAFDVIGNGKTQDIVAISMLIVLLAIFAIINKLYAVNGIFVVIVTMIIAILFGIQIINETNKNNNYDIAFNNNNLNEKRIKVLEQLLIEKDSKIKVLEEEIKKEYDIKILGRYNIDHGNGHIDSIDVFENYIISKDYGKHYITWLNKYTFNAETYGANGSIFIKIHNTLYEKNANGILITNWIKS
jgi:hypothetical protein